MNTSKFASQEPYPSLEGIVENRHDLQLLLGDYAGRVSEFSAIAQYVYHQLEFKGEGLEEVGRTLLSIAQVEMRHLNVLGEVVCKLGGIPQFYYREGGCLVPWSGRLVSDCRQLEGMLQSDLQLERQTIACYRWQGEQVGQPQITALLNRIILDEEIHVQALESLLGQVGAIGRGSGG